MLNNPQATTAYPPGASAPKEIGILQRVDGVRSGLEELAGRLEGFVGRLGGGISGNVAATPSPPGLVTSLSDAEGHLRRCFEIIGQLDNAF